MIASKITILNKTTLDSLKENDEQRIIKNFTDVTIKILHADFGFVWLKKRSSKKLELAYTSTRTPFTPISPRKTGITSRVLHSKTALLINRISQTTAVRADAKKHLEGLAIIPIAYKNHIYGNMYICFKKGQKFSHEDRALCDSIGNSTAQTLTIEKLLKQKDEFLGMASHELKTPLTTIKGFTQLLIQRLQGQDPTVDNFLSKINIQTGKLSRLIEELLDISKIDAKKLTFDNRIINLNELLTEVVQDLQFTAGQNQIELKQNNTVWVWADRYRLEEVFTNVIGNAIKYSPAGKKIIVELRSISPHALVSIADSGPGIPKKYYKRIFERFFQHKSASRQPSPGLGLGLYIAKEIVTHHDGDIWCESVPGHGTTFYIKLPIKNDSGNQ